MLMDGEIGGFCSLSSLFRAASDTGSVNYLTSANTVAHCGIGNEPLKLGRSSMLHPRGGIGPCG